MITVLDSKKLLLVLSWLVLPLVSNAQSTKPRVYIDPQGQRYTRQQFDSIGTANIGKAIAQKNRVEGDREITITFEILAVDPFEAFTRKWVGQPLPSFALKDVSGQSYTNHSLQDKLTVLNFWSVTCGPCLLEMAQLSELVSTYANKDVLFLAPAPEDVTRVQKTLAKRRFTYTVLPQAQSLFSALGINSYPYHMVIDKKGIIQAIYHGSQVDTKTNQALLDQRIASSVELLLKN